MYVYTPGPQTAHFLDGQKNGIIQKVHGTTKTQNPSFMQPDLSLFLVSTSKYNFYKYIHSVKTVLCCSSLVYQLY